MLIITYITVLSFLRFRAHGQNVPQTEDESIILHSLRKRSTSQQLGPIPYRQRDENAPIPIIDAAEGRSDPGGDDQTAVLNPNLGQAGSSSQYSPAYGQYSPSQGSENPSYDYTHSQTYSSTQYRSSQSNPSNSGTRARAYNEPVQGNSGSDASNSNSNTDASRTRTGQTGYRSQGGATATYSPTGTRRRVRGPTGRRTATAGVYPLGPIISTGGGQPLQPSNGQQVYRGGHLYQGQSQSQPRVYQGQTRVYQGQSQYPGTHQTQNPAYRGGGYVIRQQQPTYTNNRGQYTYTAGQQPTYTGFVPNTYYPQVTGGGSGSGTGTGSYYGNCPETGIRMRINGMECARAVEFYGSFLCYRHEYTSRECCETCQPLKNPSRVSCEYGDHAYQCRQIQAHDCYDLRNRQSCCETCDRLRTGDTGCEYGDMTPRCNRVSQNPSLCYIPENQRLCCNTCSRLRRGAENQVCPWGDQNGNLCRPFDQYGGVRINCYAEPIRRMCCQTCERLRSRMPGNILGCEYGDRPVIFNTPNVGSLNCTAFFRHFPVDQCTLNQAVAINCCYTCYRYQGGGRRQRTGTQGPDEPSRG